MNLLHLLLNLLRVLLDLLRESLHGNDITRREGHRGLDDLSFNPLFNCPGPANFRRSSDNYSLGSGRLLRVSGSLCILDLLDRCLSHYLDAGHFHPHLDGIKRCIDSLYRRLGLSLGNRIGVALDQYLCRIFLNCEGRSLGLGRIDRPLLSSNARS